MSSGDTERRERLYHAVGEAVHLAQTLELHLAVLIRLVNRQLKPSIDPHGLIVPEYRQTLGRLFSELRALGNMDQAGRDGLGEALEARNRITHHFFNRNVHAFVDPSAFEASMKLIDTEKRTLAIGAAISIGWCRAYVDASGVDPGSILIEQDAAGEIS
jgi:hypothetical protein